MLIPGLSRKKFFTALAVAFFILLAGGCLKYCAKASRSLETSSPETLKSDKKQDSLKPVKAPTPLSDNLLDDFPEDVKKYFQYVVLIDKSAWGSFLNNAKPLDTSKSTALSGEVRPLPGKRLALSKIKDKEDQIIVTPDLVGLIFDKLGENWYLDWDRLRDTFRPLTIRLSEGLPQSSVKSIFAEALKEGLAPSSKDFQPTSSQNPDKLSKDMEVFLENISEVEKEYIKQDSTDTPQNATTNSRKSSKGGRSNEIKNRTTAESTKENGGQSSTDTDSKQIPNSKKPNIAFRISPDLKQRLAFISRCHIDGYYVIFSLKLNKYGTLLLRQKIGWYTDGPVIVMNQTDLIRSLSSFFDLDAPTLVLKRDKDLTKLVDEAMEYRKGTNGKLNGTERNKLKDELTVKIMERLKSD